MRRPHERHTVASIFSSIHIGSIDWEAISAVVGTLVFVATLVLAWSTWEMAKAATVQADTAVKLLDASATAIPRVVRTASNPAAPWAE